jgi:hypothetical protein
VLQRHLAECRSCLELYADFRRISAQDLGLVAIQAGPERKAEVGDRPQSEKELLERVMARAEQERHPTTHRRAVDSFPRSVSWFRASLARTMEWLSCPPLRYGTLVLLLCAVVGVGAYRMKEMEVSPTLSNLRLRLETLERQASSTAAEHKRAMDRLLAGQAEREASAKSLREAQARYAELQAQKAEIEAELAAARAGLAQKGGEVEALQAKLTERENELTDLQSRLLRAAQRTEEQRTIAESLKARLEALEAASKARLAQSQSFGDSEVKRLFGARDLHIVDVYDVDSNGQTKRAYGRIYYAEKRLLIFYAFDLSDKQRGRAPVGFQAWGYSQPDENKPKNLGLFSLDDASANRWVLEVNNPRVLERIDAVFVTLESPYGSPSPRGRRLLYANLAVPPNHP